MNPISNFCWNTISSHPIFRFRLNIIPSDWNYFRITMTTTRPKPKHGETNVIIENVYAWGASLTLQFIIPGRYAQVRWCKKQKNNSKNLPVTWEIRSSTGLLTVLNPVHHYQQEKPIKGRFHWITKNTHQQVWTSDFLLPDWYWKD